MKLRKLISCVAASAVAASALATSASAVLVVVPTTGYFHGGTGSWMPVIYSDGTFDAADKPVTDYGIDCTQIGSVEVTITPADKDWFDGSFGGAIVLSSKSEANADHNWNGKEYWGTIDEDLGIETLAADKAVIFEKTGDYTYTGVMTVDDSNCVYEGYQLVHIAFQEWGSDMSEIKVVSMVVKDTAGNEMISFDENGTASLPLVEGGAAEDAAPEAEEEEAPVEEEAEEEAPAEAKAFTLKECYKDGTVILLADDGQNAYATSNGIDITDVYGYRVTAEFGADEVADEAAWIGGGIGTNSNSTGWASTEWGKNEKPIVLEFDGNTTAIELLGDAPLFAADDAYAQLWIQCWGGTMNILSVEVLGADGAVIASADIAAASDAPAVEEAPSAPSAGAVDSATDSSKGSPDTGVEDVAVVAGLAIVAAGAVLVSKKRK